ncbi:MAG: beta-N-acetylhexosaminidase [Bacteroidales bacterium]|nr:beta-N-acetylhexosaminidase [Bacteroidales bacterium]
MKHKFLLSLLLCLLAWPWAASAQTFVNLTPKPKTMTVGEGTLTLPADFVVGYSADLDAEMVEEVNKFITVYNHATGSRVKAVAGDASALFRVEKTTAAEGSKPGVYTLTVAAGSVTIGAPDALGLFYAFQSVKKMLPANVMANVADPAVTTYALPLVTIEDEPRFEYRGFMLDVSRHFFTVEDIKRMLDVMAYYKMNRFHWHLSDDQGWRIEIKKYPKLTEVGSIAANCRLTDMYSHTMYWQNKPYGPYFYTQDEIRDVVAYAQKLHIDIVPEIDMPGHFTAAMASYPEYSCTPEGSHEVQTNQGGVWNDVLNVANDGAVAFAKGILEEIIELFPYERVHIGGDECPTTAWESNAECQAKYAALNLTNYRQLQSLFIKEMSDFVQSKGRKLSVWNESITAANADLKTVQSTGAMVYCWMPAEDGVTKAAELGLSRIYTPQYPFYINKYQGDPSLDPPAAGYGNEDVMKVYEKPIPENVDAGIQATFWTEVVSDRDYLEWLTLPRLTAIAEAGWTPQANRTFSDFQQRITADTLLLNYGNYKWCDYQMVGWEKPIVLPDVSTASEKHYYRLISGATDTERVGRCIELVADGSPLLTEFSAKNIAVGRLWTNTQAEESAGNYDYQWWYIEADPAGTGKYALVCKAKPGGSVNPNPTSNDIYGRWNYDDAVKNYKFVLGSGASGKVGDNYFYTICSDQQASGNYLNSSKSGQGCAVNIYSLDASTKWEFAPMAVAEPEPPTVIYPKANTAEKKYYYRIVSKATDGRNGRCMELLAEGSSLITSEAGNAAKAGRLWTNGQAAEGDANYDCQWWSLEEDPANPGSFALVCKAYPEGSLSNTPVNKTSGTFDTTTDCRWDYDYTTKHYGFVLGSGGTCNGNYYYKINTPDCGAVYMNAASGQGKCVNLFQVANSVDAIYWEFVPADNYYDLNFTPLTYGETYMFSNAVEGFDATALAAAEGNTSLLHSTDPFAANAWTVTSSEVSEFYGVQQLNLQNATTGQYISGAATSYSNRVGYPVSVNASTKATVSLAYDESCGEYRLQINDRSFFPLVEAGTVSSGSTMSGATYDAPRIQGATWNVTRVKPVTFNCEKTDGTSLGGFTRYVDADLTEVTLSLTPEIAGYAVQSMTKTAEGVYTVVYMNVSNLQLSDASEQFEVVRAFTADQLTYTRTFNSTNWQAWYMPFAMSYEDWKDDFDVARLNDVHQYDDNEDGVADRTELEIMFVKSGSIAANTPYLIRAKEAGPKSIQLTNAVVQPTLQNEFDVTSWNNRYVFTGTYTLIPGSTVYSEGYYALSGGSLQQAQNASASLGAFRWYLQVLDRSAQVAAAPKVISLRLVGDEGEVTGIRPLQPMEQQEPADVYDLNGRLVRKAARSLDNLPQGVYIVNGKKYIR